MELVERAHNKASRSFLSSAGRARSRSAPSMTSLNFLLTRALGRELKPGRRGPLELHEARPRRPMLPPGSPWQEGHRHRRALRRRNTTISRSTSTISSRSSPNRTRVIASPIASNAVGTTFRTWRESSSSHTAPARSRGQTPCTTAHTARSTPPAGTSTSCSARRTSSSARTWGSPSGSATSWRAWAVQGAAGDNDPVGNRFHTGRPARAARRLRRGRRVRRVSRLGCDVRHETRLGQRFLDGVPGRSALRAADDGGAGADLRVQPRPAGRRRKSRPSSQGVRSRSGTATTTRSRS